MRDRFSSGNHARPRRGATRRRISADLEDRGVAPELSQRYGDVIQRISFYAPYASDPDRWAAVMAALQAA